MNPPKVFCNNSLKEKDIEIECGLIVNGLTTDQCRFHKIENCSYMREGEGSILGTFRFKKMLKIDIFISFCDRVVGAILIGGAILIICVSNFRNHRD